MSCVVRSTLKYKIRKDNIIQGNIFMTLLNMNFTVLKYFFFSQMFLACILYYYCGVARYVGTPRQENVIQNIMYNQNKKKKGHHYNFYLDIGLDLVAFS